LPDSILSTIDADLETAGRVGLGIDIASSSGAASRV